jgi:2-amino-4-hydroxy-6-hydroxymethyldihydropteridine diphosphokinase
MATVYLALGSNVGDSGDYIRQAIEQLGTSLHDIQKAPIYRSKAVGYTEQPNFLNTAISGQTDLTPEELLASVKTAEQKLGRMQRFRQGPREIDIDIIFYDTLVLETKELTIPHSAFRSRDFVLRPLGDLNPQMTDPVSGQTVTELLDKIAVDDKSIITQVD